MDIALIGGSLRPGSVSAQVLWACAALAEKHGARTTVLTAPKLVLPLYQPGSTRKLAAADRVLSVLRRADGIILATPTYHGGASGLVKNVLDYVEDLAAESPAYFSDRAVGAVAVGWSEHGAATAVADLRNAIMCLRGWPAPMGVTVNSTSMPADEDAVRSDQRVMRRLEVLVGQVADFSHRVAQQKEIT
jgi:FMN reductase